jgi:metal-responsive CopG/Arc/MetJ family transcriptional regulator
MAWRTVALPSGLVEELDAHLRNRPAVVSRAEFVRRAVEAALQQRPVS